MHSDKVGRPSFKVREKFAAELLWAEDPSVFVYRRQTNRLRNGNVFDRSVVPSRMQRTHHGCLYGRCHQSVTEFPKERPRFQISAKCKSHVAANFEIPEGETWATIQKHYKKPEHILKM
jgi:hypothetical protein